MNTLVRILFVLAEMLGRPSRERKARVEDQRQPEQHTEPATVRVIGELKTPEAEIQRREANQKRQDRFERRRLCLEAIGVAVAIATSGAVIYYAVVAADQRDQMIETNRLTRKALDTNERAHLFSTITRFYKSDENLPTAIFTLRNFGRSPAYSVRYFITCEFGAGRPAFVQPYFIDLTIPPNESATNLKAKCWNTPKSDADAMEAGSRAFYVWLLTLYRDPFKADGDRSALECRKKSAGPKSTFGPCEPGSNVYSQ